MLGTLHSIIIFIANEETFNRALIFFFFFANAKDLALKYKLVNSVRE